MNVADLLKCESMETARLLVQGKDFHNEISGINVLEALDIALWGRQRMVLLSSYFALSTLNSEDLRAFFTILEDIGISALIIKLQRLIDDIPPAIIDLCAEKEITLIQIGRTADYQSILLDVFRPVMERTEQQLALHYRLSNISSQLSLRSASTLEILDTFKEFLQLDLSLTESHHERTVSTASEQFSNITFGKRLPVSRSEYMNFSYRRFQCSYGEQQSMQDTVLVVDISCVEDREHTLIVHESRDHQVLVDEIVIIENLIRSLQTLILSRLAIRQQQRMNRNAVLGDLLNGKIVRPARRDDALRSLGLSVDAEVRVLTLYLSQTASDSPLRTSSAMNSVTRLLTGVYPESLFYDSPNQLQMILMASESPADQDSRLKSLLDSMLADEAGVSYVGGISDTGPIRNLRDLEVQSRSTALFLQRNNKIGTVESFDSLGALKLFVLGTQEDLNAFVPRDLLNLYLNDRDSYETLRSYMQHSHSHTAAAAELGVHPKTVKYRITRLEKELMLNVKDPQTASIYLMSFEILSYTQGTDGTHGTSTVPI